MALGFMNLIQFSSYYQQWNLVISKLFPVIIPAINNNEEVNRIYLSDIDVLIFKCKLLILFDWCFTDSYSPITCKPTFLPISFIYLFIYQSILTIFRVPNIHLTTPNMLPWVFIDYLSNLLLSAHQAYESRLTWLFLKICLLRLTAQGFF